MKNKFPKYNRRSIRLQDYDYSQSGAYFVTVCTKNNECLLGNVINGETVLSPIGKIAQEYLINIPNHFKNVRLDTFVIMPNHIHLLIYNEGVQLNAPTPDNRNNNVQFNSQVKNYYSHISPKKNTLSVIIRTYKSALVQWCRNNNYESFEWQRGYYDHIIRNEEECNKIREYIINNAAKWDLDKENPVPLENM